MAVAGLQGPVGEPQGDDDASKPDLIQGAAHREPLGGRMAPKIVRMGRDARSWYANQLHDAIPDRRHGIILPPRTALPSRAAIRRPSIAAITPRGAGRRRS